MKKLNKGGVLLTLMALLVQMTFMSAFFVAVPVAEAADGDLCAVDVDAMLIMDRSGSMEAGTCEWWDSHKQPEPGYVNDSGVSEGWCTLRDNFDHPATYTVDSPTNLDSSQAAANSFLALMGANDQSGLVSFSSDVSLDKQLSNDHSATETAVNSLVTGGATNIGDAISEATTELGSVRANASAVKVMILLTDGRANKPNGDGSGEDPLDVAYAEAMASAAALEGFKIFTIGLGDNVNTTMLGNIANATGAAFYPAPNQEDLENIYNSIAEDICEYGSITGCKYNDIDNDGSIEGDGMINDWGVTLIRCPLPPLSGGEMIYKPNFDLSALDSGLPGACVTAETKTTVDGCYAFNGLDQGDYGVIETQVTGWSQTYPSDNEYYYFNLAVGEAKTDIDFANYETPEEPEVVTINAFKVVCEAEEYLPNWGAIDPIAGEPSSVTTSTAADYVEYINNLNEREVCALESDWDFQWGFDDKPEVEGVDLLPGNHVGEADGTDTSSMCSEPWCGANTFTGTEYNEWKTFGSTDASGLASTTVSNLFGAAGIWVREILKEGFTPFTHPPKDPDADNVSAELYCESDIVNYDNYDLIENVQMGETYNCIAFNAPLSTPEPECGDGTVNQEFEQCDDGNNTNGDGCNERCQNEGGGGPTCGDGTVNQTNEQCDDGNNTDGDGCSASCQNEGGGNDPECGDGDINQSSEECDDGNNTSGDGCSASCTTEGGGGGGGGGLLIPTNRGGDIPVVLGEEGEPVLEIEKSNEKEFANPGDKDLRYTVRVENTGNLTAFNVVLVDTMPTGLSFVDSEGNTKNWDLGDMEPGAVMEVTYLVNVDPKAVAEVYTNVAEASADNHDAVTATADLEVRAVAVLAESGFEKNELIILLISLISVFNVIHFMKRREVEVK